MKIRNIRGRALVTGAAAVLLLAVAADPAAAAPGPASSFGLQVSLTLAGVGVNVGPNLTYVGSLATLLWRQILHARDAAPDARDFLRLGVLTVPLGLAVGVLALWLSLRIGNVR